MQYLTLKPDRILDTQRRLTERIAARFPGSGLSGVAGELGHIAEKAAARADKIRGADLPVRLGVVGVLLLAAVLLVLGFRSIEFQFNLSDPRSVQLIAQLLQTSVFLGAAVVFLITLETRLKRQRALSALHELRAIAHVIDMHQVAKSPENLTHPEPAAAGADKPTTTSRDDLDRYLNYCIALLAITSKVAALYVQEFPDAPTVAAVDQVENLCSGLSQKIWQKVMILEECREETKHSPA